MGQVYFVSILWNRYKDATGIEPVYQEEDHFKWAANPYSITSNFKESNDGIEPLPFQIAAT